ncbi:F-box only protein 43 [Bulinus truncatus]|nr:F-box only protein 43 [Bulinus truncatus]
MEFIEKIEYVDDGTNIKTMNNFEPSAVPLHTLIYSTPLLQQPLAKSSSGLLTSSCDSGFAERSFNSASEISQRSRSGSIFDSPLSAASSTFFSPEDELGFKIHNMESKYESSPMRDFTSLQGRRLTFESSDIQLYFEDTETNSHIDSCNELKNVDNEDNKNEDTVMESLYTQKSIDYAEELNHSNNYSLQSRRGTSEPSDIQPYFQCSEADVDIDSCIGIQNVGDKFNKVEEIIMESVCFQEAIGYSAESNHSNNYSSITSSPLSGSADNLEFSLQEMSLDELSSSCSSGSRSPCMKQNYTEDSISENIPSSHKGRASVAVNIEACFEGFSAEAHHEETTVDICVDDSVNFSPHCVPGPSVRTINEQSFNRVLKHYSPSEPSRLIGRNTGLCKFDIIYHLSVNFPLILQRIFQLLTPADLFSMCEVSKQWETSVCNDIKAFRRYKKYLDHVKQTRHTKNKENNTEKLLDESIPKMLTSSRGLFSTLQTQASAQVLYTGRTALENTFQPIYTLLSEDKLRRCPHCQHSAVVKPVEERATCLNEKCGYDFCTQCFSAFHYPQPCKPLCKLPSTAGVAGTRKSKKNLKRL